VGHFGSPGVVEGVQESLTVAFFVYPLAGSEKAVGLHHIRGHHSAHAPYEVLLITLDQACGGVAGSTITQ